MYPVKICIAGAGNRGEAYSSYAKNFPDKAVVCAVAEPRKYYREKMAMEFNLPQDRVFESWEQMAAQPKLADAVLICTQDELHYPAAIAFIGKGYDILLEKPMGVTEKQCRKIGSAAMKKGVIFAVCHVLRYTKYTQKLKSLIEAGVVGDVVSIQHLEPVGYWHYAHSYVRGNWANEKKSSFMLLTKSCHDLDWMMYVAGSKFKKMSSFGSLIHFKESNKPPRASERCVNCAVESKCPYSAVKIYMGRAKEGNFLWPVKIITSELTVEGVQKALEEGPYGRCVYNCDNDVVDHQVVNMEFDNGVSAVFTMTGFTEISDRKTKIFGTKGQLVGNGNKIEVFDFLTDKKEVIEANVSDGSILSGHGGGDHELMVSFIDAVALQDQSLVLSGAQESMESHLAVFAAEKARKTGKVVGT